MKTTAIVILVIAFLWVCVSMASKKRAAEAQPEFATGLTYKVSKDKFEAGVQRYEIGVDLSSEATEADVMKISEWLRSTRDKSTTFIIFYYVPGQSGAWARVDYPQSTFDLMPKLEY